MPRIKKATDANGTVFYPITISKAVWDVDNNQRLSATIANKQNVIDSSHKLSADLIEDGTTNKVINVKPDWNAASGNAAEILNKPTTMGASGSGHKGGLVPDTSSTAGTSKFLREDGTWVVPAYPAAQIQSDWNATSGMGEILNKPSTLPTPVSPVSGSSVSQALTPNTHYVFGTVTSLTVTLGTAVSGVVNEYTFEFDSGSTATTLSIPSTVLGIDTTSVEASTHYEVNIKYNATTNKYYGLMYGWEA